MCEKTKETQFGETLEHNLSQLTRNSLNEFVNPQDPNNTKGHKSIQRFTISNITAA